MLDWLIVLVLLALTVCPPAPPPLLAVVAGIVAMARPVPARGWHVPNLTCRPGSPGILCRSVSRVRRMARATTIVPGVPDVRADRLRQWQGRQRSYQMCGR